MKKPCGCCEGTEAVTPREVVNRPGLNAIAYRVGTHAQFLETMLARLSSAPPITDSTTPHPPAEPTDTGEDGEGANGGDGEHGEHGEGGYVDEGGHVDDGEADPCARPVAAGPSGPLSGLRTHQPDDPSIALLDAWATIADVLTFYQERVANEGYLRTAVERRSVVELARLLGYRPRPGVASSVQLAFTLQEGFNVTIPAGTPAMTTPGPGELPQTFETSETLDARAEWNELRPRRTRPQRITDLNATEIPVIYFDGVGTRLKPNDRLLLVFGDKKGKQFMRRVAAVEEDQTDKRTKVTLHVEEFSATQFVIDIKKVLDNQTEGCKGVIEALPAIIALRAALEQSNPLSKLSEEVKKASAALAQQQSGVQGSIADLNTVSAAAVNLSQALTALLDKTHPALAAKVQAVITAFNDEEKRAARTDAALDAFAVLPTMPRAPRVTALLAADAKLAAETVTTGDFKALVEEIRKLSADWQPVFAALRGSLDSTIKEARASLEKAIAADGTDDKELIGKLTTINTELGGVLAATAEAQTAQVEKSAEDLRALPPAKLKKVRDNVDAAQVSLDNGLTAVSARLDDALNAIKSHPELRNSAQSDVVSKNVKGLLNTLNAALNTTHLRDVPDTLATVTGHLSSAPPPELKLYTLRVQELTGAIDRAPADSAKKDLVAALDGVTLPKEADLSDAGAKTHLGNIKVEADTVRAAVGSVDAIRKSAAAADSFKDESTAIRGEIQKIEEGGNCFQSVINGFKAVESTFAYQFKQRFHAIAIRFESSIPNTNARPTASDAIRALGTAIIQPQGETVTGLVGLVTEARKGIAELRKTVPAADGKMHEWFGDLLEAIDAELKALTQNQAQSSTTKPGDQDAFSQLKDIARNLLNASPKGTPAPPDLKTAFVIGSDAVARSLLVLKPGLSEQLLTGWGNISVERPAEEVAKVYALRVRASLFGYNAPSSRKTTVTPVPSNNPTAQDFSVIEGDDPTPAEKNDRIDLDTAYDLITPSSWVVVQSPAPAQPLFAKTGVANAGVGLSRYGMTGKTTEITLTSPEDPQKPLPWFNGQQPSSFGVVRGTVAWAQSELLALAEEPIEENVGPEPKQAAGAAAAAEPSDAPDANKKRDADSVLLDGYFTGLKPGRFVAITGERTKRSVGVDGIFATELALVTAVEQSLDMSLPGDTLHTRLIFAVDLRFEYKRDTVRVNANVAHATHGATQKEVLGSGDGGQTFQTFRLSKTPLTYLSRPTPSGAESTLAVRVNDILWHEADNLGALGPNDRRYVIDIEDDGATSVLFGDGVHGSRLPTGTENVRSIYRSGIGKPGNVPPKKIGVLPSPPLGVSAVGNPAPATGGADPETRDQARRNAPVAVLALDRLVSVRDYADFARTFAGIAKAGASLEGGAVTVTIAGVDDTPIDSSSDLFHNLSAALEQFGDPHQAVRLRPRALKVLVIQMGLVINPDYDAELVTAKVRAALLDQFGFDRQELGEPVALSRVVSVSQRVPGVVYVDVELFGAVPELSEPDPEAVIKAINAISGPEEAVLTSPNEIAYFSPDLPETVVLKQVAPGGNQ